MTSLYEDLGIPPDADQEAIRKAHRRAARRHHPDNRDTGDRDAFERSQRAWLVLRDPQARERYDRTGETEPPRTARHPDRHPDQDEATIDHMLVAAFERAVAEAAARHGIERTDLVAGMRHQLRADRNRGEQANRDADGARAEYAKLRRRLRHKGSSRDPVGRMLDQRLAEIDANQASNAARIALVDRAIKRLEDYGYDFTPMQTPESAATMPAWASLTAEDAERMAHGRPPKRFKI